MKAIIWTSKGIFEVEIESLERAKALAGVLKEGHVQLFTDINAKPGYVLISPDGEVETIQY